MNSIVSSMILIYEHQLSKEWKSDMTTSRQLLKFDAAVGQIEDEIRA